jgi:hypothetical protein
MDCSNTLGKNEQLLVDIAQRMDIWSYRVAYIPFIKMEFENYININGLYRALGTSLIDLK